MRSATPLPGSVDSSPLQCFLLDGGWMASSRAFRVHRQLLAFACLLENEMPLALCPIVEFPAPQRSGSLIESGSKK